MCGICGVWEYERRGAGDVASLRMRDSRRIAGRTTWSLVFDAGRGGFGIVSIHVDLSEAAQTMRGCAARLDHLNGEIYNTRDCEGLEK